MAVNPKILIVEDDQAVLEVEKLMLSENMIWSRPPTGMKL